MSAFSKYKPIRNCRALKQQDAKEKSIEMGSTIKSRMFSETRQAGNSISRSPPPPSGLKKSKNNSTGQGMVFFKKVESHNTEKKTK